jgi:probable HAF family extracellular repeat protein
MRRTVLSVAAGALVVAVVTGVVSAVLASGPSGVETVADASGATLPAAATQARWVITDLGTLGGSSEAWAINERGQIVGSSERTVKGVGRVGHAMLWRKGRMIDLTPKLPLNRNAGSLSPGCRDEYPWQQSSATDINESGQVLVNSRNCAGVVTPPGAWLWQNGRLRALPTLGGKHTYVDDINNRGHVVGDSDIGKVDENGTPIGHAFLWQDGRIRDLGTLGGRSSWAVALNERDQVVGISDTKGNDYQSPHAFLWESGKLTDLGNLGSGDNRFIRTSVVAINNRGQVIMNRAAKGYEATHAFLWDKGKLTDLGTLGGPSSEALDINDLGQVIGRSDIKGDDERWFLWQNGQMTRIGGAGSPQRAGWSSQQAAINERGQIVGTSTRAFVWHDGKTTYLGTLPCGPRAEDCDANAISINERGQIVGTSLSNKRPDIYSYHRAVLWTLRSS